MTRQKSTAGRSYLRVSVNELDSQKVVAAGVRYGIGFLNRKQHLPPWPSPLRRPLQNEADKGQ